MTQLSSITVPLDGSSFAEQVLPLASQLARSSHATLRLALVHTPASTWDPGVEFRLFDADVERQVREREYAYLEAIARKLTADGELHVECALLSGSIAESLEDYVERTGTDLVIMTSHGRGGIGRMVLGNVADQLVHRLHVPVMILRPEEKKRKYPATEVRRIMVPLDGSALAASILDQAVTFARLTGSELLLVSVVQPIPVLLPPFLWPPERLSESPQQRELEARRYLVAVKRRLRDEGLKVQTRVTESSKVAREILQLARQEECSLIAMATHGASGLDRVMLGSVADQVVRHAEIPVLLLRPMEMAETVEAGLSCAVAAAVSP
jgi:nucleotide-binding universal stress UspA family protein